MTDQHRPHRERSGVVVCVPCLEPWPCSGAVLFVLAEVLDACEPEDAAPVTWGALRRQVRAAATALTEISAGPPAAAGQTSTV